MDTFFLTCYIFTRGRYENSFGNLKKFGNYSGLLSR